MGSMGVWDVWYFIVCVDTRDTQEGIKQKELSGAGSNAVQGQPQRPKAFVLFWRICNPTTFNVLNSKDFRI